MDMGDAIQGTLPGLEVSEEPDIMLPIDDDKPPFTPGQETTTYTEPLGKEDSTDDDDKLPYTSIQDTPSPSKLLDRGDSEILDFTIEARKQLYYELEKRAGENKKTDSFHREVGDVTNFVEINQAFPKVDITDDEGKKKDPYYTHPRQYSKGPSTYTEEIINTGNGYEWKVTKIQTKIQGGEDRVSWKFTNVSNPKYD